MINSTENVSRETDDSTTAPVVSAELDKTDLRQKIILALKSVYDPEIPVDIWELGLIYEVRISDDAHVQIFMTLTSPACPVAGSMPIDAETRVNAVEGVKTVEVELTWDPPWNPEMMSPAAKLELGF